jgi:hypothetical protein
MYIVFCVLSGSPVWISTWLEYYDAYREAESLNKRDHKAFYYVRYKENFNGKDNDS